MVRAIFRILVYDRADSVSSRIAAFNKLSASALIS